LLCDIALPRLGGGSPSARAACSPSQAGDPTRIAKDLRFKLTVRGCRLMVDIREDTITYRLERGASYDGKLWTGGKVKGGVSW
jgi:Glycosyl hydrolase family 65, C-terminal domain